MKFCEWDEHESEVLDIRGKRETFFLSLAMQKVDFGSFFCTMFINFVMRMVFDHFWRPCAVLRDCFMNFVKNYEVGVCNGFFGIGLSVEADFVNMREGQTSRMFIGGG